MRVAVVMPLYNKQATLERALNSVIAQSFRDWELIVVDDGSTDGSIARLCNIADGRIRVISQQNSGPGAARNRGVAASAAELLAFLDADDEWGQDYLERMRQALLDAPKAAAVSCGYISFPTAKSSAPYWYSRGIKSGMFSAGRDVPAKLLLAQLAFMSPCTTVVRRSIFDQLGGFYAKSNCRYGEDAFLFLKILARYPVVNLLDPLALIHFEDSALSNRRFRNREIEPFLLHPESILSDCPASTYELVKRVLAMRAFKSSCVLSSWGLWQEARDLRARFADAETEKLELASLSMLLANPFGSALARFARLQINR